MTWRNTTSMVANRSRFRFDGYRHNFGPHAWVTERAELSCIILTSFLQPQQQCRGCWIDAAGVAHWQWFEKLEDAKKWVRMNATSRWAMK